MPVNWGLAEPAAGPLDILRMAGQAQMEQLQQRQAVRQAATADRIDAARPVITTALGRGDYAGAQSAAVGAGDISTATAIANLSKEHQAQLAQEANVLGSVAYGLKGQKTLEARLQAFHQAAPALLQHGFSQGELDSAAEHLGTSGWSDEALDGYINSARTVQEQIASQEAAAKANGPFTLNQGDTRFGPDGKVIAQVAPAVKYESVPAGGMLVPITPNGPGQGFAPGGGQPPAPAPTGAQIEQAVAQLVPGAQTTSGARSASHNREVGGVSNSYHLTDQARDLVPPHGVPMDQFAATLKAGMPGFDVINEGTHVHVEPSGPAPHQASGPPGAIMGPLKAGYRTLTQQEASARGLPGGSVYQVGPEGQISSVSGTGNASSSRKAEAQLRQEFNQLPEVKNFRVVRTQGQQIKRLAATPSAQNDIAMIFTYMKLLDPTSVVREGEFATAQNAAGVPDQIRNLYNRMQSGERLNPQQRLKMVSSANTIYTSQRDIYNQRAQEYRGYATDNEVDADRVASTYSTPKRQTVDHGLPADWKIERVGN